MRHSANFGFLYTYDDFVLEDVSELFFKLSHDKFPCLYVHLSYLTRTMFDCSWWICIQTLRAKSKKNSKKKAQIKRTDFSRATFFKRRQFSFLSVYSTKTSANYRTSRPAASIRGSGKYCIRVGERGSPKRWWVRDGVKCTPSWRRRMKIRKAV